MKVLFFGSFNYNYSRNMVILKGMAKNGISVDLLNFADNNQFSFTIQNILHFFRLNLYLVPRALKKHNYDFIFHAYPLHKSILALNILRLRNKIPIISDPFVSLYNMIINDHKRYQNSSIFAKMLKVLEFRYLKIPTLVLCDTKRHGKYFQREFGVINKKLHTLYVGADTGIYHKLKSTNDKNFEVFFFGSYIPLQGVPIIFQSALELKKFSDIHFTVIGGDEKNKIFQEMQRFKKENYLSNLTMIKRVPEKLLPSYISQSDICLGIFGDTYKSKIVIPNKVFSSIAMGKPVITLDTPAIREYLTHEKDSFLLEKPSAKSLSEAILKLKFDNRLREQIADFGYQLFMQNFTPEIIGANLKKIFETLRK